MSKCGCLWRAYSSISDESFDHVGGCPSQMCASNEGLWQPNEDDCQYLDWSNFASQPWPEEVSINAPTEVTAASQAEDSLKDYITDSKDPEKKEERKKFDVRSEMKKVQAKARKEKKKCGLQRQKAKLERAAAATARMKHDTNAFEKEMYDFKYPIINGVRLMPKLRSSSRRTDSN
jgi:hypothetical protein